MLETMQVGGSNNYKLKHIKKSALILQKLLPTSLHIPLELVERTNALIAEYFC
jgi:hypothetical protein